MRVQSLFVVTLVAAACSEPASLEGDDLLPGDSTEFQAFALDQMRIDRVRRGLDFLEVLASWGPCPAAPTPCLADLDADGEVGIDDFLIVLAAWG